MNTYAAAMENVFENAVSKSVKSKNLKIANQMIEKAKQLYVEGYSSGDLKEIQEYMDHENKYVRLLAATYSFILDPSKAKKVLTSMIEMPPPNYVAPNARLSIEMWERGHLDPSKF